MAHVDPHAIEKAKEFLRQLSDEGIHVESAYLFGSYASGMPDEWSDIDVAIISRDISEDRMEERIRLTRLSSRIDSRIEPAPFSPATFIDEDPLAWEIKRSGVRIDIP